MQISYQLTERQLEIHRRALLAGQRYLRSGERLVIALQEVDRERIHKALGLRGLVEYALKELKLEAHVASPLVTVARKANKIPALAEAIASRALSPAKAARAVSCMTEENGAEVVAFAMAHTCREIDREAARRNPKAAKRDRAKPISGEATEIRLTALNRVYEKFLHAQKVAGAKDLSAALEPVVDVFLFHRDPVQKARRAQAKRNARSRGPATAPGQPAAKPTPPAPRPATKSRPYRILPNAHQKHAVFARDGGRCTHVDASGRRCEERKWLHVHHVHPASHGGSNDPSNLVLLCSAHHDLVHQMSFAMGEGEVSWLRAPRVPYIAVH